MSMITWEWSIVKPTQLRVGSVYSRVGLILKIAHTVCRVDFYFFIHWFLLQISSIAAIFLSLLPFTTILVLNCVLYYNLRKKRNFIKSQSSESTRRCTDDQKIRREHYVAAMLVLIILVYACCHSIRKAFNSFYSILLCFVSGSVYPP